jgi:phosphatidate cytidylyltransferase
MIRLISGLALAIAALAAILFLPPFALRVLATGIAGLAADEYLRITGRRRLYAHWIVVAIVMYVCWWTPAMRPINVFEVVLVAVGWVAFQTLHADRTIQDASTDVVAPAYIGLPLGMLVAVHILAGWRATVLLIGTVAISDSAQYYTGRAFGRRPLAPSISPKKTIEGALGGVLFGIVFMMVASSILLPQLPLLLRGLLGAVIVVLGIAGDLFESRLKRLAGMKDSSALIPGHGGVLDRIDALLFATPAFYYVLLRTVV